MGYLIPHFQDFFRVGVHRNELVGYSSLAGSVFLCPLQTLNDSVKGTDRASGRKSQAKKK